MFEVLIFVTDDGLDKTGDAAADIDDEDDEDDDDDDDEEEEEYNGKEYDEGTHFRLLS